MSASVPRFPILLRHVAGQSRAALQLIVVLCCAMLSMPQALAGKPVVYLTFDDGPSHDDTTDRILDTLAYYDIRATFFVQGSRVQAAPEKLRAIVNGGHAVANHTYNHRILNRISTAEVRKEIQMTASVVRHAAGIEMRCYRPPFGAFNASVTAVASAEGLAELLWTLDTLDWQPEQDRQTIRRSLRAARNGDVVLMHDGPEHRISSWEALSTWLAEAVHQYEFAVPTACEHENGAVIPAVLRPALSAESLPVIGRHGHRSRDDSIVEVRHGSVAWIEQLQPLEPGAASRRNGTNILGGVVPALQPQNAETPEGAMPGEPPAPVSAIQPDTPLSGMVQKLRGYRAIQFY